MTIHVVCVDPESGKYLAYDAEDPAKRATSYNSPTEAVGMLTSQIPGVVVVNLDELPANGVSNESSKAT